MTKKYILKPGKHQFAPGSAAIHDNDNLNDKEAEWYLKKYPHIKGLFISLPSEGESNTKENNSKPKPRRKIITSEGGI